VDPKNIKKLRVGNEKILDFYKIGQAGNQGSTHFVFLNKNSLHIIDGTKGVYTEKNKTFEKYEPKEIAANVKNAWFYNNMCFYLNSEGKLYLLNAAEKKSYPVEGITFDKDIEYLFFIPQRDLLAAIKDSFGEWSEDWVSRIDGNNIDTVFKDETQKAYIQRYSKISRFNNPSNTQNADAFEDYDTWVEAVKKTWNDINEKNNAIIDGLLKEWDIELPLGENKKLENMTLNYLFKYLPQFPENIRRLPVSEVKNIPDTTLNVVNQKYTEVYFLISLHNEAISIGSKYRGISANTRALLNDQKERLKSELAKIFEKYMMNFQTDLQRASDAIIKNNDAFRNSLKIENINMATGPDDLYFDYVILPAIENQLEGSYAVIYKKINEGNRASVFKNLGQDVNYLGLFKGKNYIYSIENGKMRFFNCFTMEEQHDFTLNDNSMEVLFTLDNSDIVIIRKNGAYGIRKLAFSDTFKMLNVPVDTISSNGKFGDGTTLKDAFTISIVGNRNQSNPLLYVNIAQSTNAELISKKENMLYIRTPLGGGTIIQTEVR
jgi:hypothetical protein